MTPARNILLVFLSVAGCGDAAPADFVTDHLVVEPEEGVGVVCRGSLDQWEDQVVRVAAFLALDVPYPITVYYGLPAVAERCASVPDGKVTGCANGRFEDTYIVGDSSSLYHEIVHGVRRANGLRGPSLFEEGIAVVLGAFRPFSLRIEFDANAVPAEHGPVALAAPGGKGVTVDDYGIAGHFTAWLLATYGQEVVVGFLNDPGLANATDDVFLDHFGLTLAEAEQGWRATSAPGYTFGDTCDPGRALAWSGDTLEYTAELACEAPHVLGPGVDLITLRSTCFPLAQPATMHVELAASAGQAILRAQDDCLYVGPLSAEHYQDKLLAAGEALDLPFAPCTWEVIVSTDLVAETDFTLRLSR